MLLTLFRHGEVEGRDHVFRGRSDPPLSSAGWQQLQDAFGRLAQDAPDRLIASPARRCREFAEHWSKQRQIALDINPDLREIDFGDWEERTPYEVRALDPKGYARFVADPESWCSPGGERYVDFRERVLNAIAALQAKTPQHAAILTHAGVIRVMIAKALDIRFTQALRIALTHASCCRIWYDGARSQLLALHSPSA